MATIECLDCPGGRNHNCDGCNVFKVSTLLCKYNNKEIDDCITELITGLKKKAKKQSDKVISVKVSIDKEQLDTAIQNVAKRLKPTKPKGDYHSVPHYRCPSCNCTVKLYEDSGEYPYCRYCGQALDWKENK